jgi:hypothetical protein
VKPRIEAAVLEDDDASNCAKREFATGEGGNGVSY